MIETDGPPESPTLADTVALKPVFESAQATFGSANPIAKIPATNRYFSRCSFENISSPLYFSLKFCPI
jgi:hypothetical protein